MDNFHEIMTWEACTTHSLKSCWLVSAMRAGKITLNQARQMVHLPTIEALDNKKEE